MMRAHTYTNTQHILHKYTTHIDLKKTFIDYTYFMNPNDSSTPRQLMRTPRRLIYANILAREHPNLFNAPSTQVQATGSQVESPIGLRGLYKRTICPTSGMEKRKRSSICIRLLPFCCPSALWPKPARAVRLPNIMTNLVRPSSRSWSSPPRLRQQQPHP